MNPKIQAVLDKHHLKIESVFIPFSLSRNAGNKYPSLNWKVTLLQDGKKILTTDYSAGCAHCPSYSQRDFNTVDGRQSVREECEKGFPAYGTIRLPNKNKPILPDIQDVIYSLLIDSDVIDYSCFEDWAESSGYNPDSRQDEEIYKACLKIGLQFRKIGEQTITELQEVYQEY